MNQNLEKNHLSVVEGGGKEEEGHGWGGVNYQSANKL